VIRPAVRITFAFTAGIFLSRTLGVPPIPAFGLLPAALLLIPAFKKKKIAMAALYAGFFLLGICREGLERRLPPEDISKFPCAAKEILTGTVSSAPEIRRKGRREQVSFVLNAQGALSGGKTEMRSGRVQVFLFNPGRRLEFGDCVKISGELKIPPGASGKGQFSYRAYLEVKGIRRVFYGYGRGGLSYLERGRPSLIKNMYRVREAVESCLERHFPFPEREILKALLIGARKNIPPGITSDFSKTGTTHILAVSGMNVSIVSGFAYFLLRLCFLPRRVNAGFCLAFIAFYAFLAGFNSPVARAGIMGAILMAGLIFEKDSELLNSLAIALFILLFLNPLNLWALDLQLSFLCILSIFLFGFPLQNECLVREEGGIGRPSPARRILRFYAEILWMTVAATLGTWPLILCYFHIFAPSALIANILVVPLMNFATFAGFLVLPFLFIPGIPVPILTFFPLWAIRLSVWINHALSFVPFGHFYFYSLPEAFVWAYYGILFPASFYLRARFWRRGKARAV